MLLDIVQAKLHLELFDEALVGLKEALEIRCCIFGEESIAVAACFCKMSNIYGQQAHAQLRDMQCGKVEVHFEHRQGKSDRMQVHMQRTSPKHAYARTPDYRMQYRREIPAGNVVRIDQGSKEHSHEYFTHTTVAHGKEKVPFGNWGDKEVKRYTTEVQRRPSKKTVRQLKEQQLVHCKEALRIFLRVFGVKHELTATNCHWYHNYHNLRWGYMTDGPLQEEKQKKVSAFGNELFHHRRSHTTPRKCCELANPVSSGMVEKANVLPEGLRDENLRRKKKLEQGHKEHVVVLEKGAKSVEEVSKKNQVDVTAKREEESTVERLAKMRAAMKISRRVWGGDDPRIAQYLEKLEKNMQALARQDRPGVFIADVALKPGMLPPASSDDDEANVVVIHDHVERIYRRLSLPGLRRPTERKEDEDAMVQMLATLDAIDGGTGILTSVSTSKSQDHSCVV